MSEYVRAPTEYRELLKGVVDAAFRPHLNLPPWQRVGQKWEGAFDLTIVGKSCLASYRAEKKFTGNVMLTFFKVYPKQWDDVGHWGAYWISGNGMKVYGDFETFKNDMMFLKLQV